MSNEVIASCVGQYVGTGVEIEVSLYEESDGCYAIEAEPTSNSYDWVEENPDNREALELTIRDCEELGHKILCSLEEVNDLVREEWLNDGQHFYEDELLGVCGC